MTLLLHKDNNNKVMKTLEVTYMALGQILRILMLGLGMTTANILLRNGILMGLTLYRSHTTLYLNKKLLDIFILTFGYYLKLTAEKMKYSKLKIIQFFK